MSGQSQIERPASQHKVAAVLGLLILSFALRPGIVSVGPVLLQIQESFHLTYTQASLFTTIPDVCMGAFALCAPSIARRFGADYSVLLALVLLGLAILLRALAGSTGALLMWTMFVGIGIAIAGSLVGGWIKTHFPQESSFFMGIYAGGLSVGATIAAAATEYIAELAQDWRIAAGIWCGLCIAAIASWSYLTRLFPKTDAGGPNNRLQKSTSLPWRSGRAWLVAIYFGCSQFIVYACLAWLAPSSSDIGIDVISGGLTLSLFTILLAAGSFAIGAISGKSRDRRGWLAVATAMTAIGLAGIAFTSSHALFCIVMIAFGQGMCFTLGMTLPLDNAQTASEAQAWTVFVLCVGYLIAAVGPLTFGALRDATGGYVDSYLMLLAVSLFMICLIPIIGPPKPVQNLGALQTR